ncbi:BAR domain-containing protein [Amylocarpus encephaloides]|uniref:BAR domain-containing protein n=1 Tax=Amylocarpus encephaloides TaxID=45428 RepID=A0A9P8C165_9HELO|nr:BAR domain-containing protein [Amylocarpus encephaloides]
MSFKGFQKSIVRAPQTFKAKFSIGEHTKDAVYIDAERRFQELETETKKLHDESKKYFDAINGMLSHQIEFSQAVAEIYKPISGRVSDPDSTIPEGNPEGIEACEQYEAIVRDLQATLAPELEMIESRVIRPADELLEIIKVIRKSATKRTHKQLDYDRHRATLKKLQDKKEKSLKDEKAMYKAENEVEQATQEFNYFNDLLKDELPKLFALEREFIRPLFQSFYYMQLNVFYTLHERMQGCDIGYFNLTLDVEEAFEAKRGTIQESAEALSITKFKTTGAKRPPGRLGPASGRQAIEDKKASRLAIEERKSPTSPTSPSGSNAVARLSLQENSSTPPPPYSSSSLSPALGDSKMGRANSTGGAWGAAAKAKGAAPPPPKPKPSRFSGAPAAETVTALYDYEAQAEGDLSFSTGDVIEIVTKTNNENEWWVGKIKGKQGQFPGNYVKTN